MRNTPQVHYRYSSHYEDKIKWIFPYKTTSDPLWGARSALQGNCLAVIVNLACSFTNEVLSDLGWNYMRKTENIPFLLPPLCSQILQFCHLSCSGHDICSPLLWVKLKWLTYQKTIPFFLLGYSLCFSSDELLHKLKPSWVHSPISHPADSRAHWKILPCKKSGIALF